MAPLTVAQFATQAPGPLRADNLEARAAGQELSAIDVTLKHIGVQHGTENGGFYC